MQWHSVKTHKPADYGYYFVKIRQLGIETALWDQENWINHRDQDENPIYDVTHFCVPEPVTLED